MLQSYKKSDKKAKGKVSVNLNAYTKHSVTSLRNNAFAIYVSTQKKPLELAAPNKQVLGHWMAVLAQEMKRKKNREYPFFFFLL